MKKLLALVFLLASGAAAQVTAPQIQYVTTNPTGNACGATNIALQTPNGTIYTCQSGVYAAVSGGGGGMGCVPSGSSGQILSDSGSGSCISNATAAGILTLLGTPSSTNLLAALTTKTGTGLAVFSTSPTLVTPALGTPSALVLTNATALPAAQVSSGALANGMTATTQSQNDNSTQLATTAYADRAASAVGTVTTVGLAGTANQISVAGTCTITTSGTCTFSLPSNLILPSGTTATTQSQNDNSTKPATTAYTDLAVANAIAGVNPAVAVQSCTTAAGNTSGLTYTHVAGIGDFFTGSVNTPITIDGHTLVLGDRLLVKNDTQSPSGAFNGLYLVTQIQTMVVAPILTRALDYDTPSDMNNTGAIPCILGTVNANTSWLLTSQVVTVGTTPLTYVQFSIAPSTILTGTPTNHGVAIGTATQNNNYTGAGTSGQVLTSNGASADPTFQAAGGGANPAGSNSEYQYRLNGTTFGAVTNSGPVPTAGWTARNSAVFNNFSASGMGVFVLNNSSVNFRFVTQSLSAPPYTVIATLDCANIRNTSSAQACGVYLYDGTKFESMEQLANSGAPSINIRNSTAVTSGGSSLAGPTASLSPTSTFTVKIVDDSTHRTFYYYVAGAFVQFFQETSGANLTPTSVGVGGIDTGSGTNDVEMILNYWCVSTTTTCNGL